MSLRADAPRLASCSPSQDCPSARSLRLGSAVLRAGAYSDVTRAFPDGVTARANGSMHSKAGAVLSTLQTAHESPYMRSSLRFRGRSRPELPDLPLLAVAIRRRCALRLETASRIACTLGG